MAYSKQVVDRFNSVLNNPQKHSVGRFDPKDPNVATGMTGAPACGHVMKLDLKLDIDERIEDVKFKTYGCGSAIASSSLFVDMLIGKTIEEAKQIKIKMGYSSDADFWDINHDVVKIRDVLDWLEEWKEKEKA